MGGYYYVTTGPLVKYTASNDNSARLYICMVSRLCFGVKQLNSYFFCIRSRDLKLKVYRIIETLEVSNLFRAKSHRSIGECLA